MRISDWSSDVCSSDLPSARRRGSDGRLRPATCWRRASKSIGTMWARCCRRWCASRLPPLRRRQMPDRPRTENGPDAALLASAAGRIRKGDVGSLTLAERLLVRQCIAHKAKDYREKSEMTPAVVQPLGPVPEDFPLAASRLRDERAGSG